MLAFAYRFLTDLGAPVIRLYLLKRRAAGREDAERFCERLGFAAKPRTAGRLIWCHAASVGEAASLLAVVEELQKTEPASGILITTGTVTSARMLGARMPKHVVHQYMPVDRGAYVKRFLDHWRPDLALWVESELWPNMLAELRARQIPAVLLNGRMSEKSFRKWTIAKGWAKKILAAFELCLTQTEAERERFAALGAKNVRCIGNIKYAAKLLPYDERAYAELKSAVNNRPCWLMASTHAGEEEIALKVHAKLIEKFPSLLTLIAPRHAMRGNAVAALIEGTKLTFGRRSKGEKIQSGTKIYLADTMGELGLFYRLSPVAVIGGSFAEVGGHNPIEPAQLGAAIILGPYMYNFSEMTQEFLGRKAALQVQGQDELLAALDRLLADQGARNNLVVAAKTMAEEKHQVLDRVMTELKPWLRTVKSAA